MLRSKVLLIAWMAVVFLFSTATVVISSDEVQDEPNKQSHEEVVLESSIPYLINYQGYLKDKAGNPITGTLPMRFSIWSESSGGIIVWSEVQSSVSITKGYFNVLLGNITSIPSEAFDDPFLWLQIEIAGETLSPREQIASVGYAFRAAKADSVSGPAGGDLTGTYPNPTIAPGAVSATKLADNAVITPKIQNGAVTQGKIAVGVTLPPSGSAGGDLTGTYPNPAIDTGVVSTGKLADNAVTSAKIQDGQVQTADLANSAVTQGKIAAGVTLPPSGSAGGDLTGTYPNPTIATGAVSTGKLADNAVTSAKIQDGQVQTADLANSAVTQGKIAAGVTLPPSGSAGGDLTGTYPNPAIATGVVSTGKLADNAVTSAKIQDGQVQTADLANGAVTQGKIAAGVTLPPSGSAGGDLTGTYPSPTIATGAVATGKLADFVATGAKSAQVKLDNGTAIRLFAEESAEVYFSDYGEGLLSNGRAHIELDPKFRQTVTIDAGHPMKVFVQVEGDCNGVYVTNKTATGFDVVELQGGKSNIPFSYRVVCKRKYYEDERLATPEEDARYNRRMMETVWPEVIAKHQAEQERMKAMEEQQRIEREKIKATPVEQ